MIKKILLTIGAIPASLLIGSVVLIVAAKLNGQVPGSTGLGPLRFAGVTFIVSLVSVIYLIWRDIWKVFFFIYLLAFAIGLRTNIPLFISGLGILNLMYYLGMILTLAGLYAYGFKIKLSSRLFRKILFVFCLIEDVFAQLLFVFPRIRAFIPSYLFGNSDLLNQLRVYSTDNHIFLLFLQIISLYALYQLAYKNKR